MAKNSSANSRTAPIDVIGAEALGVIASWDGLYHAFDGRFDSCTVTEDNGLVISGLTFAGQYDGPTIVHDVNQKGRRVPLFPTILWINGQVPDGFATAQEMTAYQVQNFKGSVDPGSTRTPKYVRDAFNALKSAQGISNKRGPKTKNLPLKNLSSVTADTLRSANVSAEDLQHLMDIASEVISSQAAAEVSTPTA